MRVTRSYSAATREAARLFGLLIRTGRTERGFTAQDLAERIGASRSTLHRIEQGDLRVEFGLYAEAAAVLGIPLFEAEGIDRRTRLAITADRAALLPRRVRKPTKERSDDF